MTSKQKNQILYIQEQADALSAEISELMRNGADLSHKRLNEMIQRGLFISMVCEEMLNEQ